MTQSDYTLKPKPLENETETLLESRQRRGTNGMLLDQYSTVKQHSYVLASLDLHFLFNSLITPCNYRIHFGMWYCKCKFRKKNYIG